METIRGTETKQGNLRADSVVGDNNEAPKKRSKRFLIVLILLLSVGLTFGLTKYFHGLHHEETDDAQIDTNISPVIPRISGYVAQVKVKDNQQVQKGDTLIVLDDRDEKIKVEQAEAMLLAAQNSLEVAKASTSASKVKITASRANISTVEDQIKTARVNLWRAEQDFKRYENLYKNHSITLQQFEQASATKENAANQLQMLVDQKNAANTQTNAASSESNVVTTQVGVAEANVKLRQADLENAKLSLSYTVITAPNDGFVSKVNVQEGQYLQSGQSLFSVVLKQNPWVTANFKETQLDDMKINQKVIVKVDAFPGHKFEAKLASFSPATGARFALLPPDNASGNFVKVVQRVPVKIEFTNPKDELVKELRPGMNAIVDVELD